MELFGEGAIAVSRNSAIFSAASGAARPRPTSDLMVNEPEMDRPPSMPVVAVEVVGFTAAVAEEKLEQRLLAPSSWCDSAGAADTVDVFLKPVLLKTVVAVVVVVVVAVVLATAGAESAGDALAPSAVSRTSLPSTAAGVIFT